MNINKLTLRYLTLQDIKEEISLLLYNYLMIHIIFRIVHMKLTVYANKFLANAVFIFTHKAMDHILQLNLQNNKNMKNPVNLVNLNYKVKIKCLALIKHISKLSYLDLIMLWDTKKLLHKIPTEIMLI